MGGLTPILTSATQFGSTLSPAIGNYAPIINAGAALVDSAFDLAGGSEENRRRDELRAEQSETLAQLQQRQQLEQQMADQNAALEREKLSQQAKQAEEDRMKALRRSVARQRTNFGSSGISSNSGSGEAVLLGLFEESEEEKAQRERTDQLRNKALDQNLSSIQQRNVLERTQLAERQRLERSFF